MEKLAEAPTLDIIARAIEQAKTVKKVTSNAGNLKGTDQKALNDAATTIAAAVRTMSVRAQMSSGNATVQEEIDHLRSRLGALEEENRALRQEIEKLKQRPARKETNPGQEKTTPLSLLPGKDAPVLRVRRSQNSRSPQPNTSQWMSKREFPPLPPPRDESRPAWKDRGTSPFVLPPAADFDPTEEEMETDYVLFPSLYLSRPSDKSPPPPTVVDPPKSAVRAPRQEAEKREEKRKKPGKEAVRPSPPTNKRTETQLRQLLDRDANLTFRIAQLVEKRTALRADVNGKRGGTAPIAIKTGSNQPRKNTPALTPQPTKSGKGNKGGSKTGGSAGSSAKTAQHPAGTAQNTRSTPLPAPSA